MLRFFLENLSRFRESNHFPMEITCDRPIASLCQTDSSWKLSKADWNAFSKKANSQLSVSAVATPSTSIIFGHTLSKACHIHITQHRTNWIICVHLCWNVRHFMIVHTLPPCRQSARMLQTRMWLTMAFKVRNFAKRLVSWRNLAVIPDDEKFFLATMVSNLSEAVKLWISFPMRCNIALFTSSHMAVLSSRMTGDQGFQ